MKYRYLLTTLTCFIVLICCLGSVNALSDDYNATDSEVISQDMGVVNSSDDNSNASHEPTSYEKFANDLKGDAKKVYLTGDIRINKSFVIRKDVTIDGRGHSIDAQYADRIFKVISASLTIKNLILKNGFSSKGGAVYCYNGSLTVDRCTFLNNKAEVNGGAIYFTYGNLKITNSHFEKNRVVSSNRTGHGGAIWIHEANSQISKTTFKSNYCLSNLLKNHKRATQYQFGGGAIYYLRGSHSLKGCTFTANRATNDGGAIYSYKSKSLRIERCNFNRNRVEFEDGGAIAFSGNKLVVKSCKFYNNLAYEDGGAMDTFSLGKYRVHVTIANCIFKNNVAYKGAGAIWVGIHTVCSMNRDNFMNNRATIGGAIYCQDGSLKVYKSIFKSNKAKKVTKWTVKAKAGFKLTHCAGAVMIDRSNVKITRSTFAKNSADLGGSLFLLKGKLVLKNNRLYSNKAKKEANEICASKVIKISNKNKWTKKRISTKKALKKKKMFINVVTK